MMDAETAPPKKLYFEKFSGKSIKIGFEIKLF